MDSLFGSVGKLHVGHCVPAGSVSINLPDGMSLKDLGFNEETLAALTGNSPAAEELPLAEVVGFCARVTEEFTYGNCEGDVRFAWSFPLSHRAGCVLIYQKGVKFTATGGKLNVDYLANFDLNIWQRSDSSIQEYLSKHWSTEKEENLQFGGTAGNIEEGQCVYEAKECVACLATAPEILLPCKHKCLCAACYKSFLSIVANTSCPMCRHPL